ncbi:hypothetical protein E3U23_02645 [Erythrobacter litoralis]|uniref:hypothetical protein n=1 Tax=Erythrobacter litoralis TaxID=39960 RepID=UPI002435ED9B|nr:hypothetical protein [Erythrobacter litoralis]MDG6078092.1 hypothetical protein [Erythrobacter litoralis]
MINAQVSVSLKERAMEGSGKASEESPIASGSAETNDFRQRMTRLLEDLDAAGETLAAVHVETALAKLGK